MSRYNQRDEGCGYLLIIGVLALIISSIFKLDFLLVVFIIIGAIFAISMLTIGAYSFKNKIKKIFKSNPTLTNTTHKTAFNDELIRDLPTHNYGQRNGNLPNIRNQKRPTTNTALKRNTVIFKNPTFKKYKIDYLYHMTHIDNLASIVKDDLLSNNLAKNKELIKTDISDHGVQDRRDRLEPIYKYPVHYYVPLYFNPRNPMLYRRKNLQPNIAILCFDPITIFNHDKVLFTDGNAAANSTKFFTDPDDLNYLDWNCLNSASYWNDFPDGKRKRCAEVLVPNKITFKEVEKILCYNNNALLKIRNIVNNNKIKVEFDGRIYF